MGRLARAGEPSARMVLLGTQGRGRLRGAALPVAAHAVGLIIGSRVRIPGRRRVNTLNPAINRNAWRNPGTAKTAFHPKLQVDCKLEAPILHPSSRQWHAP